jgi:hypothetical protein
MKIRRAEFLLAVAIVTSAVATNNELRHNAPGVGASGLRDYARRTFGGRSGPPTANGPTYLGIRNPGYKESAAAASIATAASFMRGP